MLVIVIVMIMSRDRRAYEEHEAGRDDADSMACVFCSPAAISVILADVVCSRVAISLPSTECI
jgi:hypothetical protein